MRLVLGLEIHLHVKTEKKMFCSCSADIWQAEPNTHTCPVCLGLPGALPVPNFEAVQKAQRLGLALGGELNLNSYFDRKHYFYPDLPKGYQISQYKKPLSVGGGLMLTSGKVAELERVHLEEDVGKSFHEGDKTYLDFNKSGMPLIEIVTKPCFSTVEDAVEFCKRVQDIVRILKVGDADMEKGQMRLEANISLRTEEMEQKGELLKYKVEVKNINSFRFMERAVNYEIKRQQEALEKGETLKQENRGWDEKTQSTVPQRDKEEANDYRYFPEPDIPPMQFEEVYALDLFKQLPELPWQKEERFEEQYRLPKAQAQFFTIGEGLNLAEKLEQLVGKVSSLEKAANLLINKKEYRELTNEEIIKKMEEMENQVEVPQEEFEKKVTEVLRENPEVVESYKKGKVSSVEFLLGQLMKKTQGKIPAQKARELLLSRLNKA